MECYFQAFKKIVLVRSGSLLLAVDQHAADERIRLEALQQQLCNALNDVAAPLRSCMPPAASARRRIGEVDPGCVLSSDGLGSPVGIHLTPEQRMRLSDANVAVCSS